MEALILIGLLIFGLLVMIPLSILMNAFVLHKLWAWFMVPLGIAPIGLAHAWGLAILIGLFTTSKVQKTESKGEAIGQFIGLMLAPLFALLFGWIAHGLM